jgi:HEXXH motif-containing protein
MNSAILKLRSAVSILQLIRPAYDCITNLVHSIHVLRQLDTEVDLSYSHPDIPFSIFVSVCEDDLTISNLRVAESILHEAMHLKLTLIENIVPLVKANTNKQYYSPWRGEERPIKGVLHGLFVFKVIQEFFKELCKRQIMSEAREYLLERGRQISSEIAQLKNFESSNGLTAMGANLATSLLPLN